MSSAAVAATAAAVASFAASLAGSGCTRHSASMSTGPSRVAITLSMCRSRPPRTWAKASSAPAAAMAIGERGQGLDQLSRIAAAEEDSGQLATIAMQAPGQLGDGFDPGLDQPDRRARSHGVACERPGEPTRQELCDEGPVC